MPRIRVSSLNGGQTVAKQQSDIRSPILYYCNSSSSRAWRKGSLPPITMNISKMPSYGWRPRLSMPLSVLIATVCGLWLFKPFLQIKGLESWSNLPKVTELVSGQLRLELGQSEFRGWVLSSYTRNSAFTVPTAS